MRTVFAALFVFLSISILAQKNNTSGLSHYKEVYRSAIAYGDLDVAANAIHHILVLQPETGNWEDTLARVYFSNQAYRLAKTVAEKILNKEPANTPMLTVAAYSNQRLGLTKACIPHFENLYASTGEVAHLYELIKAQFSLRRYGECAANINKLIAREEAATVDTRVQVAQQEYQQVPLQAAALNIKGVISMEMGNTVHAKEFFEQALAIMPDFTLAQRNLEALESEGREKSPEEEPGKK
jgi:tetratricopeptide (TPR) repeat protein